MHRHDSSCQCRLFCVGDTPEQAVLWDPHGPLWALNHGHAGDVKGSLCPSEGGGGLEGRSQPAAGRMRRAAQTTGQIPAAAAGSAGSHWAAPVGSSGRPDARRRQCPVPSAALPPARLCRAGIDGPGPQQGLQKLQ